MCCHSSRLHVGTRALAKKDEYPVVLTKIDGRPGKTLMKAAYGRGGQLGAFYDVDNDGHLEFVALERDGRELALTVLQIDSDRYSMRLDLGSAAAAGLTAINHDRTGRILSQRILRQRFVLRPPGPI